MVKITLFKQGAFASKISMTFLLDNIYMLIFMKDYENNIHYIYHFENSVIKAAIANKTIKKIVTVPQKLVNIVAV